MRSGSCWICNAQCDGPYNGGHFVEVANPHYGGLMSGGGLTLLQCRDEALCQAARGLEVRRTPKADYR